MHHKQLVARGVRQRTEFLVYFFPHRGQFWEVNTILLNLFVFKRIYKIGDKDLKLRLLIIIMTSYIGIVLCHLQNAFTFYKSQDF